MYHVQGLDFQDWWDLIGFLYEYDPDLKTISHNANDQVNYYILIWNYDIEWPVCKKLEAYSRDRIVYDDDWKIVNLAELRSSLKEYKPRQKKRQYKWYRRFSHLPFVYRQDPVPGVHKRSNFGRKKHHNRNYYSALKSYEEYFGYDPRLKVDWWDDWKNWDYRCWKRAKIKKQWMRHYS